MERQAIRRMEERTLSSEEIEAVGLALKRLEETVRQLAKQFGLDPSDLNLDLGPLGKLTERHSCLSVVTCPLDRQGLYTAGSVRRAFSSSRQVLVTQPLKRVPPRQIEEACKLLSVVAAGLQGMNKCGG
jgi:hypothetical protein